MIVLFGGEKGGTGKSTMALAQTVMRLGQGRDVLLIDSDGQGTSTKWSSIRASEKILPAVACVSVFGATLADQVRALMPKYDDIVIDSRGADAPELRSAMLVADVLLTPVEPSQFDLFTLGKMNQMVSDARGFNPKMKAYLLINKTPASTDEAEEMREMCAELTSYQLLPFTIGSRKAYRTMAKTGMACFEQKKKDAKAVAEMNQLAEEIWK